MLNPVSSIRSEQNLPSTLHQNRWLFAILIILTVGGFVTAGAGLGGLGINHHWWSFPLLSSLTKIPSIILFVAGGTTSAACLTTAIIKRPTTTQPKPEPPPIPPPQSEPRQTEAHAAPTEVREAPASLPLSTPKAAPEPSPTSPPQPHPTESQSEYDRQKSGLEAWVKEARKKVAEEIRQCFEDTNTLEKLANLRPPPFPSQIWQLKQLEVLDLHFLLLTSLPPQIGQLQQLETLALFENRLTSLPSEIGQLQRLRTLSLTSNRLTSLPPQIGQLQKLRSLTLEENRLTSLPEEILSLPREAIIHLENNPLSQRIIDNLREITSAPGYQGPTIHYSVFEERATVERSLDELLRELSQAVGKEPLRLTQLKLESVRLWLSRLSAIGDYKNKRKELATKIYEAIAYAENDAEYREAFLSCIQGATETCGDRMALSLLYVDLLYEISKALKAQDLKRLAYLLGHGSWALSELEKIAGNKAKTLRFVDEIEVYLAYPIMLKAKLQLPIALDTMLYFRCSSVSEADLQRAEGIVREGLSNLDAYCDYLAQDATWQKALVNRVDYQQMMERRDTSPDPIAAQQAFIGECKTLTHQILTEGGYPPFIEEKGLTSKGGQ